MAIYRLDDLTPRIHPSAWVADSATLIGDVELEEEASLWHGAIVRGDSALIRIGKRSNVQDGSVVHADPGIPTTIGEGVTVGHLVMLHGCTIGDGTLVGIGAIILNNVRIGRNCLVGAGALLTEGKEFPDGSLIVGSPAVAVRSLSAAQIERVNHAAMHYVENAKRFRAGLTKIG
jgi:carbonic anhydrase/acetyltransferase-like protein (isoleucine patch superfamily)